MTDDNRISRRDFVGMTATAGIVIASSPISRAQTRQLPTREIPSTGERIPVVGLGTADEFNTMPADGGAELREVLRTLVNHGGSLVDTSPAYGNAEIVLGELLADFDRVDSLLISSKVRIEGREAGLASLERSVDRIGIEPFDILFVHDLVDVATQLANLRDWKAAGRVRYVGISTSEYGHFEPMETLARTEELDFIQINYGVADTLAGERVIPAAVDNGIAVMANSPFGDGRYFSRLAGRELPAWAGEIDCDNWAQFSLKFVLGHPDVTCVIPGTSNPRHMADNALAGSGIMPNAAMRNRMAQHLRNL
ncbi:MAG TPA: aldo/keto reductase [Gammaproteobacteria bacterium]